MADYRDQTVQLLTDHIAAGHMTAASIYVGRGDDTLFEWTGGRVDWPEGSRAALPDDVFLIASITKPMVTSTVAKLVERGLAGLDDPVSAHIPAFAANGKAGVTLRHCFSHTSGLPDMVPDDGVLREKNAPLSEYVAAACEAGLLYEPGTSVRYQSAGILMLSAVAEKIAGESMRDLLAREVLDPAGMSRTDLCWREEYAGHRVAAKVVHGAGSERWNHNSDYWKRLGAPWGGAHSNAADVARLLRTVLSGGVAPGGTRVFGRDLARLLVTDQVSGMAGIPSRVRRSNGWGLGWRLYRPPDRRATGVPDGAFGHSGATGTLAWAHPGSGVIFVLMTNVANGPDVRVPCSSAVASALCE